MDILMQNTTDTNVKLIVISFRVRLVIDLGDEDGMIRQTERDLPCPSFCPGSEDSQLAAPSVHLPCPAQVGWWRTPPPPPQPAPQPGRGSYLGKTSTHPSQVREWGSALLLPARTDLARSATKNDEQGWGCGRYCFVLLLRDCLV